MTISTFLDWLASTPWSVALHESLYMYSFIETAHVIGITLFVGTIMMVDLRLLGVAFRGVPVSQMNGRILPWTVAGFALMMATGLALFYAIPVRTWHSVWFRAKFILMLAAAVNIWLFHRRVERDRDRWDAAPKPPVSARISAGLSLTLWIGVIVMGRMIAYDWFDCDMSPPALAAALAGCPADGS